MINIIVTIKDVVILIRELFIERIIRSWVKHATTIMRTISYHFLYHPHHPRHLHHHPLSHMVVNK